MCKMWAVKQLQNIHANRIHRHGEVTGFLVSNSERTLVFSGFTCQIAILWWLPYYGDWVWYGVEIMDPHWHLNFPLNPKKCHAIHKNHLWTPRVSSFFRFHVQSWGCDIHKSWRTTIGIDPAEMGTRLITKLSFRKDAKCHNPRYSG